MDAFTGSSAVPLPLPERTAGRIRSAQGAGSLVVGLVLMDLVTKLAALLLLARGRTASLDAAFQFVLTTNQRGLGSWARAALARSSAADAPATMCAALGLAVALTAIRRWERGPFLKGVVCAASFVGPGYVGLLLAPILPPPTQLTMLLSNKAAGVLMFLAAWRSAPEGLTKTGFGLLASAGVGNLLSFFYPPFRVVDFMYSRFAASALHYGIFNVADLYIPLGWAYLAIAAGRWFYRLVAAAMTTVPTFAPER